MNSEREENNSVLNSKEKMSENEETENGEQQHRKELNKKKEDENFTEIKLDNVDASPEISYEPSPEPSHEPNQEISYVTSEGTSRHPSQTPSNESEQACRICQGVKEEALILTGCNCKGDLALVHTSCANEWFGSKRSNICEICHQVAKNIPESVNRQRECWYRGQSQGQSQLLNQSLNPPVWRASFLVKLVLLMVSILFLALFVGDIITKSRGSINSVPATIVFGVLSLFGLVILFRSWLHSRRMSRLNAQLARLQNTPTIEINSSQAQSNQTPSLVIAIHN